VDIGWLVQKASVEYNLLMRHHALILLSIVPAVTACKVGPNYTIPEMPIPDSYAWADGESQAPPYEPDDWWRQFNDPTLDLLIDIANNENYDLRIAVARVEQYAAQFGIASSELYPDIGLLANYTRNRTPEEDFAIPGFTLGGAPYNSWRSGIGASWEIDLFGRIARAIESAQGDLQSIVEDWRFTQVTIRAEVATSYITIRTLQARLTLAQRNIASQAQLVRLIEGQVEQGTATATARLRARVNLAEAKAVIPEMGSSLASETASLALLLGATPGELDGLLSAQGRIPVPPNAVSVGIPADLLRRRPDVRAAERALAAATAGIGEATAGLYPQLTLTGQFGFGASNFQDMFQWASRAYTAGPQITWDIFNGDRVRSTINQQKALTREALFTYEQTMLQAIGEVEGSLVGFTLSAQQRDDLTVAASDASLLYDLAIQQYEQGVTTAMDVITALETLLEVQDVLTQSRGFAAESLVTLYRSLGGGWTPGVMPELTSASEEESS
jgi:multidrug efflux system outer membrane protein